MLPRVRKVEYLGEYKLRIQFTDGKIKIVDLEGRLKNAKNLFTQLKDLDYFKKVECDGYSICWPNGIDFCPDLLYKLGKDIAKPIQREFWISRWFFALLASSESKKPSAYPKLALFRNVKKFLRYLEIEENRE